MSNLRPLSYMRESNDIDKIILFLKDIQEFFQSIIYDFSDYFRHPDMIEKKRTEKFLNPSFKGINEMVSYIKELQHDLEFQEQLSDNGLLNNQLHFKLRIIEQARNQFLVSDYTLKQTNSILEQIEDREISNDARKNSPLWNKTMVLRREEKRNKATKWLERIEILLDSLIGLIPGGELLKEGKDFLKNLLLRGF